MLRARVRFSVAAVFTILFLTQAISAEEDLKTSGKVKTAEDLLTGDEPNLNEPSIVVEPLKGHIDVPGHPDSFVGLHDKRVDSPEANPDPYPALQDDREPEIVVPQPVGLSRGKRKVRSYVIKGNEMTFNSGGTGEAILSRSKRASSPGSGVPEEYSFTLEAESPHDTEPANFMIGSVISYRLTIHANVEDTDVKIEIFSELAGGPYFMVSNVRFGSVGSNFGNFEKDSKEVLYEAKFNDGRWDYARIDLGTVSNTAIDVDTAAASQIEVLFEVQALVRDDFTVGDMYRVSVGALYGSDSYVMVAQDDLTYQSYTENTTPVDGSFSITGPDSLILGTTGVWTITSHLHDLYNDVTLDVLAPLHVPDAMSIDRISIASVGENYKYSIAPDDIGNFSRVLYDSYGSYARLELGTIINAGYHDNDPNSDLTTNQIVFEVAITMNDHVYNDTSPYTVGFTLWTMDASSVEIMWSAQEAVQATADSLPSLASSPEFTVTPSASTVKVGGQFALLINMSIPSGSSSEYQLEVSAPTASGGDGLMDIGRLRLSRIGFNMPHVRIANISDPVYESADGSVNDYAVWDLGLITNTAQRDGTDDQILQMEVAFTVLDKILTNGYSSGDAVTIVVGMKHDTSYYWVGNAEVTITSDDIVYSSDQVPTFTLTNLLSDEGKIYPDSAAVLDMDVVIPPGVDYAPLTFEMNTQYGISDNVARLRIISSEIIHFGDALLISNDTVVSGLNGYENEVDSRGDPVYSQSTIQLSRVTSLRDSDYPRYSYKDSTIRIRTTVVSRSEVSISDDTTYWVESTVSFASSYIYAARTGLFYDTTVPDLYATNDWQPLIEVAIAEGSSNRLRPGGAVIYEATVAVPYGTTPHVDVEVRSHLNYIQVCKVEEVSRGNAIVNFDAMGHAGDVVNRNGENKIDYVQHYNPRVSSYSYDYFDQQTSTDSYMKYRFVANLMPGLSFGNHYTFPVYIRVGSNTAQITEDLTQTIYVEDVEMMIDGSDSSALPEIEIGHVSETNKINIGGTENFYLNIYVAPGSQYDYDINIFAPYNASSYGDVEVLEAHISYVGASFPCFLASSVSLPAASSSDNSVGRHNYIHVDLGYLINAAPITMETVNQDNLIQIIFLVRVPASTSAIVDDVLPISATVELNQDEMWVGFTDMTVIDEADETNVVEGETYLEVISGHDNTFDVGETLTYTAKLYVSPGTALTQFKVFIHHPLSTSTSEPLTVISNAAVTTTGQHIYYGDEAVTIENTNETYSRIHTQIIDFGFIRNTNYSAMFDDVTTTGDENVVMLSFSVRMLDDVDLAHASTHEMLTRIEYGLTPTQVAANGSLTLTVNAPSTDRPVFTWSPSFPDGQPSTLTQDSLVKLKIDLKLEESSKRFPENVLVSFRVAEFSELVNSTYTSLQVDPGYTAPTEVTQTGLHFLWDKMRFSDTFEVEFLILADPNHSLQAGLGDQVITMPVDVRYELEDKDSPGTFIPYFTEIESISFDINIPDCYDPLGMDDSSMIKDCQITASIDDGINVPANARPSLDGWATISRGRPLYQSEYIQVDMGGKVKFTGITIYPFRDSTPSRITSFNIQISREGLYWRDIYLNPLSMQPGFSITWPASPTYDDSQFIDFGKMKGVGQYIRLLPQANNENSYVHKLRFELHGCPESTLPTYQCPSEDNTLQPYDERVMLAVPGTNKAFVCTLSGPGELPYCSGSIEYGAKWFALDNNVMNLLGYETSSGILYALARNRKNYLRSKDMGHRWFGIETSVYTDASGLGTFQQATVVPFVLNGTSTADLYTNYGTEADSSHFWSVSEKALHCYSTNPSSTSVTDDQNQVAYWGERIWSGP